MIIGDGMLATALAGARGRRDDVCMFASGVSDSTCGDPRAFARERALLAGALERHAHASAFVYFGTCSANLPGERPGAYLLHKLAMERLVAGHRRALVLRLPHLAGQGGHPSNLLNYLRARIAAGEEFELWTRARRSVIDVDDVADAAWACVGRHADGSSGALPGALPGALAGALSGAHAVAHPPGLRERVIDIATPARHGIAEIVRELERATGRRARARRVDRGLDEPVDLDAMRALAPQVMDRFDDGYLSRTVLRYHCPALSPSPSPSPPPSPPA